MRRNFCGVVLAVVLVMTAATTLLAQETGTPLFKAPYRAFKMDEFGASVSQPGNGIDVALEGFYRYGSGPHDISFRGGFANPEGSGDTRLLLGVDFRTRVLSYSEAFPLDGALTVGFGGNLGTGPDRWYLPVGISAGRQFGLEGSNTTFVPYVHPVLVPTFGGGGSTVDFALGLGVDLRLGRDLALRASGGLGHIRGVGLSVAYTQ